MASAIEAFRKKVMQLQGPILGEVFESCFSHGAIHFKIFMFSCYI